MKLENIVANTSAAIHLVWPKDQKYIEKYVIHARLLETMGFPPEKQKNWRFCRLLKASIKASIECQEVTVDGYHYYKRTHA